MESGDDAVLADSWGAALYIGAGERPPAGLPRPPACPA
jgi:hypothetical protein